MMAETAARPESATFGSWCSGIGTIDLGLERAGMRCIWQAEVEPHASAVGGTASPATSHRTAGGQHTGENGTVLAARWPGVPNLGDITTVDWSTVERPHLVCGGYPCQPFSRCRTHVDRPGDAEPWSVEPDVGRMADGPSSRMDRSRLYTLGNAVVPQIAEWIGRRIAAVAGPGHIGDVPVSASEPTRDPKAGVRQ